MLQTIGQLFSCYYKLNLLPGVKLSPGLYQVNIRYTTDIGGQTTMHHISSNSRWNDDMLVYKVGHDVVFIDFEVRSLDSKNPVSYQYIARIDDLILLNLALKFLKKQQNPLP